MLLNDLENTIYFYDSIGRSMVSDYDELVCDTMHDANVVDNVIEVDKLPEKFSDVNINEYLLKIIESPDEFIQVINTVSIPEREFVNTSYFNKFDCVSYEHDENGVPDYFIINNNFPMTLKDKWALKRVMAYLGYVLTSDIEYAVDEYNSLYRTQFESIVHIDRKIKDYLSKVDLSKFPKFDDTIENEKCEYNIRGCKSYVTKDRTNQDYRYYTTSYVVVSNNIEDLNNNSYFIIDRKCYTDKTKESKWESGREFRYWRPISMRSYCPYIKNGKRRCIPGISYHK